ncbi:methyltransferase family protein [Candidatus Bipolaricaulota bacterium]
MKAGDRMSASGHGHQQREGLLAEHPWGDAGQIVFAILFLVVWIVDTFVLRYTTFINVRVPFSLRAAVGTVNILVALYMARSSQRIVFGKKRDKPEVIREGVYGIVRHPMYLSEILLGLGILLFSLSLAAAGVWVLAIGFLHFIAKYEERQLLEHFGNDYRDYMQEVRMWLPSVSGRLIDR